MSDPKAPVGGRLRTESRDVAALAPAGYNPRKISDDARGALAASLERFGYLQPIVVNRRTVEKSWPPGSRETVVGGHQRLSVLQARGVEAVDVVLVDLTWPEERALNLALNSPRLAGTFTSDVGALVLEVQGAHAELASALLLPGLAADVAELTSSAAGDELVLEEPPVPPSPEARTRLGDVWELGPHRLVCGDSTKAEVLELALAGARADLVFTDPPYGVSYKAPSGDHEVIVGDDLTRDQLLALLVPAFKLAAHHAKDAAAFYVWHASSTREDFAFAMKAAGLVERQYLIWAKPSLVLGHADYHWSHEPCFYAAKAGKEPAWHGGRRQVTVWRIEQRRAGGGSAVALGPGLVLSDGTGDEVALLKVSPKRKLRALRVVKGEPVLVQSDDRQTTVWEVARDVREPDHPTQKPVALAARAIQNSSQEGEHVLDSFAGSGSTLLACEQLGRVAHLVELDRHFCDVIVARWEKLTGKQGRLAGGPSPSTRATAPGARPKKARK